MLEELMNLIRVARGESPAELVIKDGYVINVFTEEIYEADIAIYRGFIVRVGNIEDLVGDSTLIINAKGKYVSPSFIDSHIHIESSMLTLTEFTKSVVPRGTGGIIADPHELANVVGLKALEVLTNEARTLPLDLYLVVPSCVPAAPNIDISGAEIDHRDIRDGLRYENVVGLGEMMNYPGVIFGDKEVLAKIVEALDKKKIIDGHAPLVLGKDLQTYILPGVVTDHESTTENEIIEKLRNGMYVMLREGSLSKNLELVKVVLEKHLNLDRCLIVSDDIHPDELLESGHMDTKLRKAVELGVDPIKAIKMVTLNPSQVYGLKRVGAIAPGYKANLVILNDLSKFDAKYVIHKGKVVAKDKKLIVGLPKYKYPEFLVETFKLRRIPRPKDLELRVESKESSVNVRVIGVIEGSLLTEHLIKEMKIENGRILLDPKEDVIEIVVVERHKGTGYIGKGLVKGFGLKSGAIASSISHDSHNIIAIGTNTNDLAIAIESIYRSKGGIVAVNNGQVLVNLPLPIAGLISNEPIETVSETFKKLKDIARKLGSNLRNPYMTLSFLALPVIPKLKITPKGLFDVEKFKHVDLLVENNS